MRIRQALNRLSGIAIVLLPIMIAWVVFTDLRTIQATNRSIARQDAVVDSLRAELRALKKQVKEFEAEHKEMLTKLEKLRQEFEDARNEARKMSAYEAGAVGRGAAGRRGT